MITLPFLLLPLFPFVIFDNDYALISYPLCNSNTLWNILMVLGRIVEQDESMCCAQEWQLCLSYLWHYLPLLYMTAIMLWALIVEYPSEQFDDTWLKCRTGGDDTSHTRVTTLAFFLLELSPFVISPEHEVLIVSYCDWSVSVVRCAASTIALKAYSSYTPVLMDSKLGRKHQVTCRSKIAKIIPIGNPRWLPFLKIYFSLFLLNQRANWLETW